LVLLFWAVGAVYDVIIAWAILWLPLLRAGSRAALRLALLLLSSLANAVGNLLKLFRQARMRLASSPVTAWRRSLMHRSASARISEGTAMPGH
jgi:hypothetical protein